MKTKLLLGSILISGFAFGEVNSAGVSPTGPSQVGESATPQEQVEKINAAVDAFVKEYAGISFGATKGEIGDRETFKLMGTKHYKLNKPCEVFDSVTFKFAGDKIATVVFAARVDRKYSEDSVKRKFKDSVNKLSAKLGYGPDFKLPKEIEKAKLRPRVQAYSGSLGTWDSGHYMTAIFNDTSVGEELK